MSKLLSDLDFQSLAELVESYGEPKYRAKQLMRHIVNFDSFDEYTDIPKSFIVKLVSDGYVDRALKEKTRVSSSDGSVRYLLEMTDGDLAEAVFLPHGYGNSVCVSCQIGCAMGCVFCASGYYGLKRDLSAGEILSQVLYIARQNKDNGGVKKVVMMGSGSPLANYDNSIKFIRLLTSADGFDMSMRSVSLSTCGLPDKIERLSADGFTGTLSLSLHAATDEKRKKIMRVANSYSVRELISSLKKFFDKTGRRVVIEYILIGGFNDTDADAKALCALLKSLCCHINLIPLNPTDHCDLKPCSMRRANEFCKKLNSFGLSATVRRSMGSDVAGACGQLKNRTVEREKKVINYKKI